MSGKRGHDSSSRGKDETFRGISLNGGSTSWSLPFPLTAYRLPLTLF